LKREAVNEARSIEFEQRRASDGAGQETPGNAARLDLIDRGFREPLETRPADS
jgi:hypothetical protein